jgi:hypothetical protein
MFYIIAFDSDMILKSDDPCGDSNKYKIGYLLNKLGHKSITLDARLFLQDRFKDNGYVRMRVEWVKKDKSGNVVEGSPLELPNIMDDDIIKQSVVVDISEKLAYKVDEIWSQTIIYKFVPIVGDEVEKMINAMFESVNNKQIYHMLERVDEGQYIFETKHITIKLENGELLASGDGLNFIKFEEYLAVNYA